MGKVSNDVSDETGARYTARAMVMAYMCGGIFATMVCMGLIVAGLL